MSATERKTMRVVIGAIALVVAFVACTSGGETYTLVTDCLEGIQPDAGCDNGATDYTCSNGALPSDSDPTLICGNGSSGANSSTIFCCASQEAPASGCSVNGTCTGGEIAYVCTGAGAPSQSDPTLICEANPQTGANTYCCIPDGGAASTSCNEISDGGCDGGSSVYVCPSSTAPNTNDPTLSCGAPTALSGGFASYCCSN